MPTTVDYYLAPQSPWTYLGHERFARIAAAAGATGLSIFSEFFQVELIIPVFVEPTASAQIALAAWAGPAQLA